MQLGVPEVLGDDSTLLPATFVSKLVLHRELVTAAKHIILLNVREAGVDDCWQSRKFFLSKVYVAKLKAGSKVESGFLDSMHGLAGWTGPTKVALDAKGAN